MGPKALAIAMAALLAVSCSDPSTPSPTSSTAARPNTLDDTTVDTTTDTTTSLPADPTRPTTWTVEPFDMDGTLGITLSVTQLQFGGRYCPCIKIPYPADGFHNQAGADAIAKVAATLMQPGDTLMGFSLGVQVISLYLAQNTLPNGVRVLLAGDTFDRNQELVDVNQGIPWDITNQVTMVANEYDGWSDKPSKNDSPNYGLATQNATAGTQRLHYYAKTNPDDPANVVTKRGNITAVLVPTQHLPQNYWLRGWANGSADALDAKQRPLIDSAYDRPGSSPEQRLAAASQQVPQPNPAWANKPEPAAAIP